MNTCVLTGHLGTDPESFFTEGGTQIVSFPIAFKSTKDKTNWIKICCFNKTAEVAEKYLHKGAKVGVVGMLDMDSWETDSGEKKKQIKVIGNSIEFIRTNGKGFESNDKNHEQNNYDDETPF